MPAPHDPVPVYNGTAEDIPAYAVVETTGAVSGGALVVGKPTADGSRNVLVVGEAGVPAGRQGQASLAPRVVVLYDAADGTPTAGAEWGAKAESWRLGAVAGGFVVLGGAGGGRVNAVRFGAGDAVGAVAAATDCRFSAAWDADTCLTWAVPEAGRGRCASVPVQTVTPLTWDADAGGTGVGGWVGVSPLATDIGAAEVRIWREKGELVGKAVIDATDYWLTRTGCRDGKVVFVGGRELCTEGGEEVSTTCGDHTFEVEVGCDVCGDAEGVVAECCPGVFIPSELCMAFDFTGTDAPGFLSYASVDGPTAVGLKGSYTARLVGMAGFTDDGFTGLGWVAIIPIADNAGIDGFAVGVWCNGGEWRARGRYTIGGTATGTYYSFLAAWITADCDPFSVGIAPPGDAADPTFTFAAVPAEGCGTGTGEAPTGSDAGGDYGGLCDAVLGVGGPLDPGSLGGKWATAGNPYSTKFDIGWDAATATQVYDAAEGGAPLMFFPATPGDPPNRMVFYVRSGVAYLGVWEGRLPPIPFDPADVDYAAAADATPDCGGACFKAVFTDATLLGYAANVTGGEIVIEVPVYGECVPAGCGCGTELTVGTPAAGDDTPGEWLACVTIPADGTYRMCMEILTGSGAYMAYTAACGSGAFTGKAVDMGDGLSGLTIGTRTAGEVVYFRVYDSGGYGAATFDFKVVAGGTC